MEKMNQVSVSEFFAKSKEEMYDMAVEMVEKHNRLVDICNDSAERMADLIERHKVYTNALNKDIASKDTKIEKLEKEIEGRKECYTALKELMDTKYISIDDHNNVCKAYEKKVDELEKEVNKWRGLAKMNRDTICNQYDVCEDFKKKIAELEEEVEELKVDLIHEREKNEKLAKDHAELENDIRKYTTEIKKLEKQVKYLEKELNETCTCKELDLKGHNRREMALVNELADKNDEIKSLKEENSYLKSEIKQKQNIIKKAYDRYSDEVIKTRKDLMEVAYRDIEKDNGYVGFKLYVKSALIEAKGDKNEANEVITEAVRSAYAEWDKTQKENEKTIKKAIKEVMNKKYGYAGEIAFRIRSEVDKKRIVDIGEGAEKILGVSRELFDAAIKALVDDGYQEIIGRIPQATNSYVYMDMHVLATPDVETKETANAENIKSLDFDIPCGGDAIE